MVEDGYCLWELSVTSGDPQSLFVYSLMYLNDICSVIHLCSMLMCNNSDDIFINLQPHVTWGAWQVEEFADGGADERGKGADEDHRAASSKAYSLPC